MAKIMTPDQLADHFLDKFDSYNAGEKATDGVFSIPQIQQIVNTIMAEPIGMTEYFCVCTALVESKAMERYHGEHAIVVDALKNFNGVMMTLLIPALGYAMQENQKMINKGLGKIASDLTTTEVKNKGADAINMDPDVLFKNLDFKLPDWQYIPPDR